MTRGVVRFAPCWWAGVGCADPQALDSTPTGAHPVEVTCVGADPRGDLPSPIPTVADAVQAVVDERPIAGLGLGVARGGAPLWVEGFGQACPLDAPPLEATGDTPFAVGSVTKVVIATLVVQLEQEGLLDLDRPVAEQAPALAGVVHPLHPDVPITPRHLLTHTSGLYDLPFTWDATWVTTGDAEISMERFVVGYFDPGSPYAGGDDMWWPEAPGTFSCYSNMAFATLGVLAEQVSGRSLPELARERLFEPLGMTSSAFLVADVCDPDTWATGVKQTVRGVVPDPLGDGPQPEGHPDLASGMLRTSAHDLLRFAMAMGGGGELDGVRVLDEAAVAAMWTRQLDPALPTCGDGRSDPAHQALGWMHLPDADGTDWVGHYGGVNGFMASMWIDPGGPARYVVLMNQLDPEAMNAVEVTWLTHLDALMASP